MQVMLRAQKCLIGAKENALILALFFHLSEGVMRSTLIGRRFALLNVDES